MPGNAASIGIMSFNIRHGEGMDNKVNLNRICAQIEQGEPDIVGLQEVDRYNPRSGFVDQIKMLARKLGMHYCFAASIKFGLTEYGNAIVSKYPILERRVKYLPGKRERRSMLHAKIQHPAVTLDVVNTHLGVSDEERAEQLPLLVNAVDIIKGPSILMGDFNMEISDPLMTQLLPQWHKVYMSPKTATLISGVQIDHIFTNRHISAAQAKTIPGDGSDHFPVIAQIPLNMLH